MTEIHIPDEVLYAAIAEFNGTHATSYAKFNAVLRATLAEWVKTGMAAESADWLINPEGETTNPRRVKTINIRTEAP